MGGLDGRIAEAIAVQVVALVREELGLRAAADEWIDAKEAARRFGLSRAWVYAHAGQLGAVGSGRGHGPGCGSIRGWSRRVCGRLAARSPTAGRRTRRPASRWSGERRLAVLGVVALLLIAVGFGLLTLSDSDSQLRRPHSQAASSERDTTNAEPQGEAEDPRPALVQGESQLGAPLNNLLGGHLEDEGERSRGPAGVADEQVNRK